MATITVPPGKGGVIIFGSTNHLYLREWELALDVDNELYKHFEMTTDSQAVMWAQVITGHGTGEATVRGNFDNTVAAYLPTSKSVWIGQSSATGWLGYTSACGFDIAFTVINIRALQAADRPAGATYEARIRITACLFNAAGP